MRRTLLRLVGLPTALFLTYLGMGCQPTTTTPNNPNNPAPSDGPKILSLGTNVSSISENESFRVVAVVTDGSGLSNLAGGDLSSPDGKTKYGAFQSSQPGSYEIDLSWNQLNQTQSIDFGTDAKRSFTATFYNSKGQKVTQNVDITLTCKPGTGPVSACGGKCLAAGAMCSTGKICVTGVCQAGCYINMALQQSMMADATEQCRICDPAMNLSDWTAKTNGTSCGGTDTCQTGRCIKNFGTQAPPAGLTGDYYSVFGVAANDVYAVGVNAQVIRTVNGGAQWTDVRPAGFTQTLRAVWGSGATDIYVAGAGGSVLRTTNSGANWTILNAGTTNQFNGLWGSNTNNVWAVGNAGTVRKTISQGNTWMTLNSGVSDNLLAVWGVDSNTLFTVGANGTILKSVDSGNSWTRQTSNVGTAAINGIWGSGINDIYVVTASGLVRRSTDGGVTWNATGTVPNQPTLTWIFGTAANNVYIAGNSGYVFRSPDSGVTWIPQNTNSAANLTGLWGSSAADLYVVGLAGLIRHTN